MKRFCLLYKIEILNFKNSEPRAQTFLVYRVASLQIYHLSGTPQTTNKQEPWDLRLHSVLTNSSSNVVSTRKPLIPLLSKRVSKS